MKIVQVTPCFPPNLGGMEQRVRDLSENLAKKGHEIKVITSSRGAEKGKLKSKKGLEINYLKSWELAHTPITPGLFFKLMKLPKDSLMHVHAVDAFYPTIALMVSKIKNIPIVGHIRGDIQESGKWGFLLPLYKKIFLRGFLKNSDKIIALNEDYKNMFRRRYSLLDEKFKVIPNATKFEVVKKPRLSLHSPVRLLFVGRMSVDKNIPILIKAVSSLKDKDVHLYLVGDGEEKQKNLELVKKYGLDKKVTFVGRLDSKKLYNKYLDSDIVLLPSKVECFGSVLLEAMATGKPVIASNIPGIRSVIKDGYNGILIKPTSKNIAKAVEKLIKKPGLRNKLVKNGLEEVKNYSWLRIVEQTESVYSEVLEASNKN
jgi:glycosyltransferase involved in cell wall biosynthesis